MNAKVVSIRIWSNLVDAEADATVMRNNGFDVSEVLQVSNSVKLADCTVEPSKLQKITAPAWVVIGRR